MKSFKLIITLLFLSSIGSCSQLYDDEIIVYNEEGTRSLMSDDSTYPYSLEEDIEFLNSLGYCANDLIQQDDSYYFNDYHYQISKADLLSLRSNTVGQNISPTNKIGRVLNESIKVINISFRPSIFESEDDNNYYEQLILSAITTWNKVNGCRLLFTFNENSNDDADAFLAIFDKSKNPALGNTALETIQINNLPKYPNSVIINSGHDSWNMLSRQQQTYFIQHAIGHVIGWSDVDNLDVLSEDNTIMHSQELISSTQNNIWSGFSNNDISDLKKYYAPTERELIAHHIYKEPETDFYGNRIYQQGSTYKILFKYLDPDSPQFKIEHSIESEYDSELQNIADISYIEEESTLSIKINAQGEYKLRVKVLSMNDSLLETFSESIIVVAGSEFYLTWTDKQPIAIGADSSITLELKEDYTIRFQQISNTDEDSNSTNYYYSYQIKDEDGNSVHSGNYTLGNHLDIKFDKTGNYQLFFEQYRDSYLTLSLRYDLFVWAYPELSFEWEREPVKSFMTPIEGAGVLDYQEAHEFYLDVNKVYPVHINYVNENYPGEVLRLSYTTEYINPSYEKCVPDQTAAIDVDSDFPEDMEPGDTPVGGNTTISYLPTEDGIPLDYNYNIRLPIQPGLRKLNFTVKKVSDEEVVDNFHIYIYGLADGYYYAPQTFEIGDSCNCKYIYGHPEHPNATVTQIMTEPVFNHPLRFGNQWQTVPITEHGAWFVTATVKEGSEIIKRSVLALVDLPNSPQTSQIEIRMEEAEPVTPDIENFMAYENYILHYTINFEGASPFVGFVATEKEIRTYGTIERRVDRQWVDGDPVLVKHTSSSAASVALPSTSVMYTNAPFVQEFHYYTRKIFWPRNGVHLLDNPNVLDLPMHEGLVKVVGDNGLSDVRNRPL